MQNKRRDSAKVAILESPCHRSPAAWPGRGVAGGDDLPTLANQLGFGFSVRPGDD